MTQVEIIYLTIVFFLSFIGMFVIYFLFRQILPAVVFPIGLLDAYLIFSYFNTGNPAYLLMVAGITIIPILIGIIYCVSKL